MIVQSFDPGHMWHDDFAAFCAWIGDRSEIGAAIGQAALHPLPDGRRLILGWADRAMPAS